MACFEYHQTIYIFYANPLSPHFLAGRKEKIQHLPEINLFIETCYTKHGIQFKTGSNYL